MDGVIAASWWPDPEVFELFKEKGIKSVVNVFESLPLFGQLLWSELEKFETCWFPVPFVHHD